jgi:hypothetical protein
MDPERTTTIGEGESARMEIPFHIMPAVDIMRAKLRIWAAAWRGFWRKENIVFAGGVVDEEGERRELRSSWGFCRCRGGKDGIERCGELEDRFGREWQPGEELSRPGVLFGFWSCGHF